MKTSQLKLFVYFELMKYKHYGELFFCKSFYPFLLPSSIRKDEDELSRGFSLTFTLGKATSLFFTLVSVMLSHSSVREKVFNPFIHLKGIKDDHIKVKNMWNESNVNNSTLVDHPAIFSNPVFICITLVSCLGDWIIVLLILCSSRFRT